MALTGTNIIGRIALPDDTNPVNSVVRFVMTGFDTDDIENATVIQIPIDATIDALGDIDVDLWPNPLGVRSTFYATYARIPDGNTNDVINVYLGQISVPSTGGPYDLNDLLPIAPPAGADVSDYIAQLAAAVASTESAATSASADATQTALDRIATGLDAITAEAARDAAFVNADVYADIATGRAAVLDGEQFMVVSADGLEIVRYRRDSASTQTEVARYPSVNAVEAVAARAAGFINPPSASDPLYRVHRIEIYKSINGVSVDLPALFAVRECGRDLTLGGRFRLRMASFDGVSTYGDLIRERGNGTYLAGAQSGLTWVDIEASTTTLGFAVGTLLGRALVDFGVDDTFGTYAGTIAYSVGGIYPDLQQTGKRFQNDVTEIVGTTLARSKDQKLPFSDDLTAVNIRNLVRSIRLYNADKSKQYSMSVCTIESFATPLTRFRVTVRNITDGVDVCTVSKSVSSQPGFAAFVATLQNVVKLTSNGLGTDTGIYAVVELDFDAVSDFFSYGATTVAGAGLSPQIIYDDGDISDYLESDHVHETIRCGVGETYTTLRAAVESTYSWVTGAAEVGGSPICDRASYHHRVLIKMIDDTQFEATLLKIPEWVELAGNGYDRTTVVRENTNADEVLTMHLCGKMRDFSIISQTPSEYCIHSDDFNRNADGGDLQNRFIRQSFKRMRLRGLAGHDGVLFGGGLSAGQHILMDDVIAGHDDAAVGFAGFFWHNTGPTVSVPSITIGVKPSLVEMRGCSSPNRLSVYIQTLEPAGISTLSLRDCNFARIDHAVATGEVAGSGQDRIQWDIVGNYDGPWMNIDAAADAFTLEWVPSATPKRQVFNDTGAVIPKGRFVKFTGATTVAPCGPGEPFDGWTHAAIGIGASGYVILTDEITDDYIESAVGVSGDWGIAAGGLIDYAAAIKLGRAAGGVVRKY